MSVTLVDAANQFQTQEQAVAYLERIRWGGRPVCPYCFSDAVARHASRDRPANRWQCQKCTRAFSATVGTVFHGTHVPLRDWLLCIALLLGTRNPPSAYRIARELDMREGTVRKMIRRIRGRIDGTNYEMMPRRTAKRTSSAVLWRSSF